MDLNNRKMTNHPLSPGVNMERNNMASNKRNNMASNNNISNAELKVRAYMSPGLSSST